MRATPSASQTQCTRSEGTGGRSFPRSTPRDLLVSAEAPRRTRRPRSARSTPPTRPRTPPPRLGVGVGGRASSSAVARRASRNTRQATHRSKPPASTSPSRSSSRSVRRRRGARSADPSAARRCVIRGDCSLNISQRHVLAIASMFSSLAPSSRPAPLSLPRALRRRVFLLGFRASSERLLRETHPDPRSLRSPRSRPVFVLLFQSVSAFSAPEAGERVSTSRAPLQPRRLLRPPSRARAACLCSTTIPSLTANTRRVTSSAPPNTLR